MSNAQAGQKDVHSPFSFYGRQTATWSDHHCLYFISAAKLKNSLIMKFIKDIPPCLISINVNKVNPQLLISVFNSIIIVLRICVNSKFLEA